MCSLSLLLMKLPLCCLICDFSKIFAMTDRIFVAIIVIAVTAVVTVPSNFWRKLQMSQLLEDDLG